MKKNVRKVENKTEYGTILELVDSKKKHVIKEFWGDHHFENALAEYNMFAEQGPVNYHVFKSTNRDIK